MLSHVIINEIVDNAVFPIQYKETAPRKLHPHHSKYAGHRLQVATSLYLSTE